MTYNNFNGFVILEPDFLLKASSQRPMRQCNEAKVGTNNQLMEPYARQDVRKSTFFLSTHKVWKIKSSQNKQMRQEHLKK